MATTVFEEFETRPDKEKGRIATRKALVRLSIACATFLSLVMLSYVVPPLARYRPWVPGEPSPLRFLYVLSPTGQVESGAEELQGQSLTEEQARASLARTLGQEFAYNLDTEEEPSRPPEAGTSPGEQEPADLVSPKELQGLRQRIEDPSGHALYRFYRALLRTAMGRPHAVTRIAHYGDSTIAADDITYTLRRKLQARFGDAGHGFVLLSKGTMPYRHRDVVTRSWGFRDRVITRRQLRDGRYGYGGVALVGHKGAWGMFATTGRGIGQTVSRFEVLYLAGPRMGTFDVHIDGKRNRVVDARAPSVRDGFAVFDVPEGSHRFKVRVRKGKVRFFGVVLERDVPGVVYDSLGIVGARAVRLLNFDPEHIAHQIAHRSPDLIILAFGGNEAADRRMNFKHYEKKLHEVVRLMRAGAPQASCLLMAPLDQGERHRGRIRTIPTVPHIVRVQRKVAFEEGCGFFDTFKAMGGPGSMWRWYRARPRLAWGDFRHATPRGYVVIANMFYKALLAGFKDYLSSKHDPGRRVPRGGPSPGPLRTSRNRAW